VTDVLMLQRLSADLVDLGLDDADDGSQTRLTCGCEPTLVRDTAEEADW
jgi:hypothetical protein